MHKVFITGTSSGLGLALSETLPVPKESITGFSRRKGIFAGEFHTCDFTKPKLAQSILDDAFSKTDLSKAERIIFVHNAGQLGPLDSIQNLDAIDIRQNLTANVIATGVALSSFLRAVQTLPIPKLFLNISSGAALPERAKPGWSLYCAAKAGQEQLIRAVALEQAQNEHPTKLINFNPGVMETGMQRLIRATPENAFPEVKKFIKLKEEGGVPEPSLIASHLTQAITNFESLKNGNTYQYTDFEPIV